MASKKKKYSQYYVIVLVLLMVLGLMYFLRIKNYSSSQSKEWIETQSSLPGYKHYANLRANFSIDYPSYLYQQEYDYKDPNAGRIILLCEAQMDTSKIDLSQGTPHCPSAGLSIWFTSGSAGWGGGCDPENHDSIILMGKPAGYCRYERSFGQLYYGPPRGEENNPKYNPYQFLFGGTYGEKLTRAEMEKMIATFKVID